MKENAVLASPRGRWRSSAPRPAGRAAASWSRNGGADSGSPKSDAAAGDAGKVTRDGGACTASRAPLKHRPGAVSCSTTRGPGSTAGCHLDGGPSEACVADSNWTAGHNGRCFIVTSGNGPSCTPYCSYDECVDDSDCPGNAPCECRDPSSGSAETPNLCFSAGTSLRDLEAQASAEQAGINAIVEASRAPAVLPHPEELGRREFELESIHGEDPNRGRELLARLFEEGAIRCTPNEDGDYVARSRFFPLALLGLDLGNTKPRSPFPVAGLPAPSRGFEPSCSSHRWAGLHRDFPDQEEHGVPDCWAPFEGRVTVGWE